MPIEKNKFEKTNLFVISKKTFLVSTSSYFENKNYHIYIMSEVISVLSIVKKNKMPSVLIFPLSEGEKYIISQCQVLRREMSRFRLPILFMDKEEIIKLFDQKIDNPFQSKDRKIEFTINSDFMTITVDNKPFKFSFTEFKIMKILLKNLNSIVTRRTIEDYIWHSQSPACRSLDSHMCNLRKKIQSMNGVEIVSAYSSGYILRTEKDVYTKILA